MKIEFNCVLAICNCSIACRQCERRSYKIEIISIISW